MPVPRKTMRIKEKGEDKFHGMTRGCHASSEAFILAPAYLLKACFDEEHVKERFDGLMNKKDHGSRALWRKMEI